MRQTNFANDTALKSYFQEIGIIPKGDDSSEVEEITEEDSEEESNEEESEDEEKPEPGIISTQYPTILNVKDGLGHTNYSSFGQENSSTWTRPTIQVGSVLNINISTNNPNESTLYYKYDYQSPGQSFITFKDWSTSKTAKWIVPSNALGKWLYIMVSVKDSNDEFRFDGSDDYTYLIYNVTPKDVVTAIYPTITNSKDSKGNINANSIGGNEGLTWTGGEFRAMTVGETVTFTITASDPNGDALLYQFLLQPQGGSFETLRGWSSSNTYTWTVPESLKDNNIYIMAAIKDNDSYLQFGDSGDDYNYLIYSVK
ncbi:MAG: hypothetical protein PHE21_02105 [Candidatus Dojkabacteria bacterium]|nr:hypothetical protein [Candidatus Dojkabacteria bacterium]